MGTLFKSQVSHFSWEDLTSNQIILICYLFKNIFQLWTELAFHQKHVKSLFRNTERCKLSEELTLQRVDFDIT